jgi:hypothetical protein
LYVKNDEFGSDIINKLLTAQTFMGYDITMLRGKIHEAFMGYMKINLIHPPKGSHWGQFNDRPIELPWIAGLVNDFKEEFVDNCSTLRAIEVGVKPAWLTIKVGDIPNTSEGLTMDKIPMLELSAVGKTEVLPENLWFFGGNHRREALKQYLEELGKDVKALEEDVTKVLKEQSEEFQNDKEITGNKTERIAKVLKEKIAREEMWVVRLYDRGTPDETREDERELTYECTEAIERDNDEDTADAIFRLLSRNETKSLHKATEEELLHEVLQVLNRAYQKDLARLEKERNADIQDVDEDTSKRYKEFMKATAEKAEEYKVPTKRAFRKLVLMPMFTLAMVMASRVRRHYSHAPWFKVSIFYKMAEVHGAVSTRSV